MSLQVSEQERALQQLQRGYLYPVGQLAEKYGIAICLAQLALVLLLG